MLNINDDFTIHPRAKAPAMRLAGYTLDDVYERPSVHKRLAFDYCKRLCERYGGWDFRISSHNTMTFTVMFDFQNPDTGELMRAVITRDYNRAYYI